jgi:hypothetical protein
MNAEKASCRTKIADRILPLFSFLFCSLLPFEPPFFAFNSTSKSLQVVTFIGLPMLFSMEAMLARCNRRFMEYLPAFCSFLIASVGLLLMCYWTTSHVAG